MIAVRKAFFAICLAVQMLLSASNARTAEAANCHIGTYQLADGDIVDIAPSEGKSLRWRRFDGTTGALAEKGGGLWTSTRGWTAQSDGISVRLSACQAGRIDFDGIKGRLIRFQVVDTTFVSNGVTLVGRLVLPQGANAVPIVILVHGSEHDSAVQLNSLQRMLPAQQVGAFVYDKRGTGESGGSYTQDFNVLADDAVAAMHEAKRLAGRRTGRIGYQGASQGGWVAPLAANRAAVDFVIVCFGLAVTVIDEDQQAVEMQLRDKGYSANDITDALEVARAAETVFASGFAEGFKEFDAVRAKFKDAPWYKDLLGNFTYALLPYSESQLRDMSPKFKWGTPFHYDPMPTLRANTTPQLWILGGRDYEAPAAETSRRVKSLIADGRPFTLALYPQAEHGMTLFETVAGSGERLSTKYAPGYFSMIRDFARQGEIGRRYGDAEITPSITPTR